MSGDRLTGSANAHWSGTKRGASLRRDAEEHARFSGGFSPALRRIWLPAGITAFVVLAVLSGGAWFYRYQEQSIGNEIEKQLTSIALLKVDQIAGWRQDMLGDATLLAENRLFAREVKNFLIDPRAAVTEDIRDSLSLFQEDCDDAEILLVDRQATVRFGLGKDVEEHSVDGAAVADVLRKRQPELVDLHADGVGASPHLSVVAPIIAGREQGEEPVGAIILISDARRFLYPLIQSWPTPSATAETLLVRRDGDHVVFLNDLRHQPGSAIRLRLPITATDTPAVMAVSGRRGFVLGRDYRGVEVASVLQPIPDSPWFLVAKVDVVEAFAEWRVRSRLILLLLGSLVTAACGFGLLLWQRKEKAHYRASCQAAEALRESEERLSATLRSIGDGVIACDADGKVTSLNLVAETLTGWSADEARGLPITRVLRLVHAETHQQAENPVERAIREDRIIGLAEHTALIARDGTEHQIADSCAPIHDLAGRAIGAVLVFRDVTEECHQSERLRESETRLRAITDSAQDAILMMDADGRVSYWNPAAERILGYTRDDAMGQDLHQFLAPRRFHAAYHTARPEFNRSGRGAAVGRTLELAACRKDGREITVSLSLSAVYLKGEWHAVGILRDITEQKQAEKAIRETSSALHKANLELEAQKEQLKAQGVELVGLNEELKQTNVSLEQASKRANDLAIRAEAANCAKSEFLTNMSHEIRTPMTAILGYSDLVAESLDCCRECPVYSACDTRRMNRQHMQAIRRNGEHLLQLINDVLDLSKIEAEKMTIEQVPCSIQLIVAEVASFVRVRANSKGLNLIVESLGPVPETIRTDPLRLRQILVNLLGNAIKFTEVGEVRLQVCLVAEGGTSRMQFEVVDTGVGMTEEQATRIMQPFAQADASTSRQFGGTGLGLVISKRLAQLLGGDLRLIETQLGRGTRFRATVATGSLDGIRTVEDGLSLEGASHSEADTVMALSAQGRPETLVGYRILLAEDGPDNQRLIAHILEKAGAAVTVVENGQLAVEAALASRDRDQPFDVVLMDMQMSVLDGYAATRNLRASGYEAPIIALTAHAMADDRRKCLDAGCDDYASKPIDKARLLEVVREQAARVRALSP